MLQMLPTLARDFGDPIRIVELGANDGYHTGILNQFARGFGRQVQYVALEPDPRLRPVMPPGVQFIPYAIAAKDGEADFHLSSGGTPEGDRYTGSSSLRAPTDTIFRCWPHMRFEAPIRVRTVTLDTLYAQCGMDRVDFIWCDVQGCEIDVIRGGRDALSRTSYFYTEYCDAELYTGQGFLADLVRELEGIMHVHHDFKGDVLFRNDRLRQ